QRGSRRTSPALRRRHPVLTASAPRRRLAHETGHHHTRPRCRRGAVMTESKHTPGPWEVRQYSQDAQVLGPGFREVALVRRIHGLSGDCPTELRIEQVANAALIARAPDLLREVEALRAQNAELLEVAEGLTFVVGIVLDQVARDGQI